jgi:hypothetical protein
VAAAWVAVWAVAAAWVVVWAVAVGWKPCVRWSPTCCPSPVLLRLVVAASVIAGAVIDTVVDVPVTAFPAAVATAAGTWASAVGAWMVDSAAAACRLHSSAAATGAIADTVAPITVALVAAATCVRGGMAVTTALDAVGITAVGAIAAASNRATIRR